MVAEEIKVIQNAIAPRPTDHCFDPRFKGRDTRRVVSGHADADQAEPLRVDFGALGVRSACVEVSDLYEPSDLVGLQVVAVVNLPPERVAGLDSQAAVLSVDNGRGERILLMPERPVPDGGRVG